MTLTPRTEARAEDAIEKGEAVALLPSRVAYPTSPPRSVPLKKGKPGQMSQIFWLLVWTLNNISVTLINKASFASVDFRYPYTLSATHMLVCAIGSHLYLRYSTEVTKKRLDSSGDRFMMLFSIPFTANIVLGNISLQYVSISFNQIMRSLVPAACMAIEFFCYKRSYSLGKRRAVVPIMIGVALACYGDLEFSALGFFVTALLVVMAAVKVVISGHALTGEWKLHPVDLLSRMAPLCLVQMLFFAFVTGELSAIWARWHELANSFAWPVVIFSGFLAFSLNICSLLANKATSPLTLTVVANVKQVLMIVLSTILYSTPVSHLNAIGILVVIIGSARYSYEGLRDEQRSQKPLTPPASSSSTAGG